MALEALSLEGVILFRDSPPCHSESVICTLLQQAKNITVFTAQGRKSMLIKRYPDLSRANFKLFSASSTEDELLKNAESNSTAYFDSLELLIEVIGPAKTASLMHSVKEVSGCVMARCSTATLPASSWNTLTAVAHAIFLIHYRDGQVFSDSLIYKRSGKFLKMVETVELKANKVHSKKYVPTVADVKPDISAAFDAELTLKDSEKKARDSLLLPYMSKENTDGLVALRNMDKKVRVGGQVIYTPDEGDDLDDSDPDDDLNL